MDSKVFQNDEKRKFDRKQLYYYLKVNHDQTNTLAGYLGDISTQGIMLFSKDSVEPDKAFNLRINLYEEFGMDENLVFEARSLWCEKDANPEYFIIGFKFIDLDQAGIDTVKYLIKKYGSDTK
ncbi:MAG: PilZ domain-containing protein [Desulfobacula sp.]|nr:PilZ domain-containing protein [Desulfobacula sp.]MCK5349687.1 PilZ domain-containing protein [Desulfobacula sp.]